MLAAGATATGANVSAIVQRDWRVRPNLMVMVVGYKGSGKSTLAETIFAPLREHEQKLRLRAAMECGEPASEEEDFTEEDSPRRKDGSPPGEPCVIVNDVSGPGILRLLEMNDRQLLVHTDEAAVLFSNSAKGIDRTLLCELSDGRSRSRYRVTDGKRQRTLATPHLSLLGTIQPSLLTKVYNPAGDDGLIDRMLLVGTPGVRPPSWPEDSGEPGLDEAWGTAINRLFEIEHTSASAPDGAVQVRFQPEAVEVFRRFHQSTTEMVLGLGIAEEQWGVVNKILNHGLRLAVLHRCFRWADGEFGESGPLGEIDQSDAAAACDAAAFFFGRWLVWRPELQPTDSYETDRTIGLHAPPANDPALQGLQATAAAVQANIHRIERVTRHLRTRATGSATLGELASQGPLVGMNAGEILDACEWLVDHGYATWGPSDLVTLAPARRRRPNRQPKQVYA